MKELITAQEASRILNLPAQAIREMVKRSMPPFDSCSYVLSNEGTTRKRYVIMTRKLLECFGIEEKLAEQRLGGNK